jgi:hypothetical protein
LLATPGAEDVEFESSRLREPVSKPVDFD